MEQGQDSLPRSRFCLVTQVRTMSVGLVSSSPLLFGRALRDK